MKRTINEIYELLKAKIENCENDILRKTTEYQKLYRESKFNESTSCRETLLELHGELSAYIDLQTLIETSEVLNERKN